jgi:acyl-CoA thioesterase
LLGQAFHAALLKAPHEREPTAMQFPFLQGAMPDKPVDYTVSPLQRGKRFHSMGVRRSQGERTVLQAQESCGCRWTGRRTRDRAWRLPTKFPSACLAWGRCHRRCATDLR